MLSTFNVVGTNTPEKVPSFLESSVGRGRCPALSFLSTLESRRGPAVTSTRLSWLSSVPVTLCHHLDNPPKKFCGNECRRPSLDSVKPSPLFRDQTLDGQCRSPPRTSVVSPCSFGSRRETSSSAVRVEKFGRRRDITILPVNNDQGAEHED